jgi:hypothetical protein
MLINLTSRYEGLTHHMLQFTGMGIMFMHITPHVKIQYGTYDAPTQDHGTYDAC